MLLYFALLPSISFLTGSHQLHTAWYVGYALVEKGPPRKEVEVGSAATPTCIRIECMRSRFMMSSVGNMRFGEPEAFYINSSVFLVTEDDTKVLRDAGVRNLDV